MANISPVTQYAIPEVVWQNDWVEVEESTTGTPSDEEDAPPLRRSHRPKATLKRTRESSGEESFASESESDSDSDVVIIEDTKGASPLSRFTCSVLIASQVKGKRVPALLPGHARNVELPHHLPRLKSR